MLELIKSRVTIDENGCWIYPSTKTNRYANLRIGDKNKKVHRLVYEAIHGSIPEKMEICHKCDVGHCCNPEHLFLGTHTDNMRDMARKGRSLSGERWRKALEGIDLSRPGVRNGNAKLTEQQVREIRSSKEPSIPTAKKYGVGKSLICYIRNNQAWRHIK